MFEIVDFEQDMAGKFRFRILIDGQTVMFKFQDFPNDEEVQAEAQRYFDLMQRMANDAADTGSNPNA